MIDLRPAPAAASADAVARERHRRLRRASGVAVVLAALVSVGLCASVMFGSVDIPLTDVIPGLFGYGEPRYVYVLRELRLPRALGAIAVGGALAVSGSIFQTMTRNPLASPDFIGITPAAALAASFAILVLSADATVVAIFALVGAVVAAVIIYSLSWRRGSRGFRLILIGIGVGAIATAITSWLLTQRQALQANQALIWITGSLNDVSPSQLYLLALVLAASAVVLPFARSWLNVLELGDDSAASLGLAVERARAAAIAIAVLLVSSAVAVGGPITFVALVSAPIARRLTRSPGLVPLNAALVGALILLASDAFAQRVVGNQPVGVVTGVIGAPYLIWLLTRSDTLGRKG